MATTYPVNFATQLRQHMKALRKSRGLTQAQLGELLGISQARVAEIEANPGLVKFEQLMQLLSALNVTMLLSVDMPGQQPAVVTGYNLPNKVSPDAIRARQDEPTWPAARQPIPTQPLPMVKLPVSDHPDSQVQPIPPPRLTVRAKKGIW